FFFYSSRRQHTSFSRDWSSDVCSSDLIWIKIFTLKTKEELDAIIAEHEAAPHLRVVQKALAKDITIRTHSMEAYETAVKTSEFLFGNGSLEFLAVLGHEGVLEVFDGVPQFTVSKPELEAGINILDLLAVNT